MSKLKPKKRTLEELRRAAAADIDNASEDNLAAAQRKQQYRDRHGREREIPKLAHAMDVVRGRKDELEEQLKEVNAEYDVLRLELLPTLMEDQGVVNQTISDFFTEADGSKRAGRVQLADDLFVRVPKDAREKFYAWLKKNKLGALVVPTVNSSTLKAFTKDRIKAGKPIPSELKVTPFARASIVRA